MTADWFPRGSLQDREEWSRRHPFLAATYWGLLMSPLWFAMALAIPFPWGLVVFSLMTVAGGALFGVLLRRALRRSRQDG